MQSEYATALKQFSEEQGISIEQAAATLEAALSATFRPNYQGQEILVQIERNTGNYTIYAAKTVRLKVAAPSREIGLAEARRLYPDARPGDRILTPKPKPPDAGRTTALAAKQAIGQQLELRKTPMVSIWRNGDGLPQNPSPEEAAYVALVLERQVPEIKEGAVVVKTIAREAGLRTKIAVAAAIPKNPIGACVGHRGQRVQKLSQELNGEKVEILHWTGNDRHLVAQALRPAVPLRIELDAQRNTAVAFVPEDQLAGAIGRGGHNARLANKLTGLDIAIRTESQPANLTRQADADGHPQAADCTAKEPAKQDPVQDDRPQDLKGLGQATEPESPEQAAPEQIPPEQDRLEPDREQPEEDSETYGETLAGFLRETAPVIPNAGKIRFAEEIADSPLNRARSKAERRRAKTGRR